MGVNVAQSAERVLVVDTAPVLAGRMPPEAPPSAPEFHADVHALQVAILLLSVCHTVVVVQDQLADPPLWEFVRTALMLKHRVPDVSTIGMLSYPAAAVFEPPQPADEFTAELVFAINRLAAEDLPLSAAAEQRTRSQLKAAFSREPQAVFFLPDEAAQAQSPASLAKHLEQFTQAMLEPPRRGFKKPLNPRDWAKNVGRTWDLIQRSSVMSNYSKILQKAGGY
jgi:hypothetical protein